MPNQNRPADIPYLIPRPQRSASLDRAEQVLNDRIVLSGTWPPYQLHGLPTWDEDPYRNNSWRLYFQGLLFVDYLLDAYEVNGDLTYLLKARLLITGWWAARGDARKRRTAFAWNEHSVALRTMVIARFLLHWQRSPLADAMVEAEMTEALRVHAERLADDAYYERYNHGILQDRALLQIAVVFPGFAESPGWQAKAISRLLERCRDDVTPSGVHKEHSPFYHLFFLKLFFGIRDFLAHYGLYRGEFDPVLAAMERYVAYVVRDDGTVPPIGDTRRVRAAPFFAGQEVGEELRYVLSGGTQGRPPAAADAVWTDAGVAIFRDGWGGDRPVSLVFLAGFHSTVHKHADDLSFVLRVGATDVLDDGSSFNYDRTDPMMRYLKSSLAHNAITVDGASYPVEKDRVGRSAIDGYELRGEVARVRASHRLYDGVVVRRELTYRKPDEIHIHDSITSEDDHEYAQVFNTGERAEVSGQDAGCLLSDAANGVAVELVPLAGVDEVRHYRGQTEPLVGWASSRFGEAHPINAVHFVKRGKSVEFATKLVIRR
ncbi:MAG TPA: heparinase II/III family protein [Thermomicrobiales bacterium]|jgi:hypothetical protein